MHLKKIEIKNHPILGNVKLDLLNKKTNQPFSIVAFVGENGCGKTTLLNELFNYNNSIFIKKYNKEQIRSLFLRQGSLRSNALKEVRKLIDGKDMFPSSNIRNNEMIGSKSSNNILSIIEELQDSQLNEVVKSNNLGNITCSGEVSKLIDGKPREHNIDKFSSGQQEILLKLKDLIEIQENYDFLLIDEPETSLHPRWQKNIVDLLFKIVSKGKNEVPQFFVATHSEKVLESLVIREDALIIRLSKTGTEPIEDLNLPLPKPTFAELDYKIFKIPSFDYHNELYAYLGDLHGIDSPLKLDKKIRQSPLYSKDYFKKWENQKIINNNDGSTRIEILRFATLPSYIRNYFHHPKDGMEPTTEELVKSIIFLENLIQSFNK